MFWYSIIIISLVIVWPLFVLWGFHESNFRINESGSNTLVKILIFRGKKRSGSICDGLTK